MKKPNRTPACRLKTGELYLFHPTDSSCPPSGSLWGVVDEQRRDTIHLESSSGDLRHFRKWHRLPERYRYCRLATRSELRDYMAALILSERNSFPSALYSFNPAAL